jgi:hypothetical protein
LLELIGANDIAMPQLAICIQSIDEEASGVRSRNERLRRGRRTSTFGISLSVALWLTRLDKLTTGITGRRWLSNIGQGAQVRVDGP